MSGGSNAASKIPMVSSELPMIPLLVALITTLESPLSSPPIPTKTLLSSIDKSYSPSTEDKVSLSDCSDILPVP